MKQHDNLKKTWLTLYSLASILFLIIGVVMVAIDDKYLHGSQYLVTALVFSTAIFLIAKNRITPNYASPTINLGFIFSTIGLSVPIGAGLHIGLWALGILLFLSGLFSSPDESDEGHERKI